MSAFEQPPADGTRVPEELAHRILARAIELEARQGPSLTLAQLRELAHEAGIPAHALTGALEEWQSPRSVVASTSRRPRVASLLVNVVSLGGWWLALRMVDRAALAVTGDPRLPLALDIATTLAAAAGAWRLGARPAAGVLAAFAAAQLAAYPLLALGITSFVGSPPVWAALAGAALLGVGAGAWMVRRRHHRDTDDRLARSEEGGSEPVAGVVASDSPSQHRSLRLRPV